MSYKCDKCDQTYESNSGLWKHNKKNHNVCKKIVTLECQFCNKTLSDRICKWRHEKVCKSKSRNEMNETILRLTEEIRELKKNIGMKTVYNFSGPVNNGPININNNNQVIYNIGEENINKLTKSEIKTIKNEKINGMISLIEHLNFNERLPQYHNFYISALNGKYVNTLDGKTNSFNKQSKTEFFDKVLIHNFEKLKTLYSDSNNTINNPKIKEMFDSLTNLVFVSENGKKDFFKELNMLSYNKRNLIINTWKSLVNDFNEEFRNTIREINDAFDEYYDEEYIDNYGLDDCVIDFIESDSDDNYVNNLTNLIKKRKS